VQNGREVYDTHCVSCHGPALSGGIARSLTGRDFKARWTGQSPPGLRDYIRRQMPPGQAGSAVFGWSLPVLDPTFSAYDEKTGKKL